jgi:hypothetical protein
MRCRFSHGRTSDQHQTAKALADNQGELAKMWAELGKRSLAAS